jgi:hypothetical protein
VSRMMSLKWCCMGARLNLGLCSGSGCEGVGVAVQQCLRCPGVSPGVQQCLVWLVQQVIPSVCGGISHVMGDMAEKANPDH